MAPILQPFHLLSVIFAGWANRHQQRVIEYLLEENRTLKQQLGRRKLRLTDAQRARLAVKGKASSSARTRCTVPCTSSSSTSIGNGITRVSNTC